MTWIVAGDKKKASSSPPLNRISLQLFFYICKFPPSILCLPLLINLTKTLWKNVKNEGMHSAWKSPWKIALREFFWGFSNIVILPAANPVLAHNAFDNDFDVRRNPRDRIRLNFVVRMIAQDRIHWNFGVQKIWQDQSHWNAGAQKSYP